MPMLYVRKLVELNVLGSNVKFFKLKLLFHINIPFPLPFESLVAERLSFVGHYLSIEDLATDLLSVCITFQETTRRIILAFCIISKATSSGDLYYSMTWHVTAAIKPKCHVIAVSVTSPNRLPIRGYDEGVNCLIKYLATET